MNAARSYGLCAASQFHGFEADVIKLPEVAEHLGKAGMTRMPWQLARSEITNGLEGLTSAEVLLARHANPEGNATKAAFEEIKAGREKLLSGLRILDRHNFFLPGHPTG